MLSLRKLVVYAFIATVTIVGIEAAAVTQAARELTLQCVSERLRAPETDDKAEVAQTTQKETNKSLESPCVPSSTFKQKGVIRHKGYKYTYYSSRVLHHYKTNEWHTVDGYYYDKDGYVVVASSDFKLGTVIEDTPFGAAKVYDAGCAHGVFDVYVNW